MRELERVGSSDTRYQTSISFWPQQPHLPHDILSASGIPATVDPTFARAWFDYYYDSLVTSSSSSSEKSVGHFVPLPTFQAKEEGVGVAWGRRVQAALGFKAPNIPKDSRGSIPLAPNSQGQLRGQASFPETLRVCHSHCGLKLCPQCLECIYSVVSQLHTVRIHPGKLPQGFPGENIPVVSQWSAAAQPAHPAGFWYLPSGSGLAFEAQRFSDLVTQPLLETSDRPWKSADF